MDKSAFEHAKKKTIYCGELNMTKDAYRFEVIGIETIPTKLGYYTGTSYFLLPNYSSEYIEDCYLDRVLEITDKLSLYYSESEKKCKAWLEKELFERTTKAKNEFEKFKTAFVGFAGIDKLPTDLDERVLSMLEEKEDETEERDR